MPRVFVLYPVLLAGAIAIALSRRDSSVGFGPSWFAAWAVAGALFVFSFLAGLSIGLLVLPFAAALLLWVAVRAPHAPEAVGFVVGGGADVLLVGAVNDWRHWYVIGAAMVCVGLFAYATAQARRHARTLA